jgi:glycosyltransferase involved in cell wall biosynthesis
MKVCHLSSVHHSQDSRVFQKQCRSLAGAGYTVDFVVAESGGDETIDGVQIHRVRRDSHKLARFTCTVFRVFRKALSLDADLYHFHDPELVFAGLLLKMRGKRVIYDIHEDYSSWLTFNESIPPLIRIPVARIFSALESMVARRFDALVTVTPPIRDRFASINPNTFMIRNFPLSGEFDSEGEEIAWESREDAVCYIGGITPKRGLAEMIRAVEILRGTRPVKLLLGGDLYPGSREILDSLSPETAKLIEYLGYVSRPRMRTILRRSKIGLLILHPERNFFQSYPTKLFEYMSASIPVVCSDFPILRDLDKGVGGCIHVDPLDPKAIAEAILRLLEHPGEAESMGRRGREAVREKYSWEAEQETLISIYTRILNP